MKLPALLALWIGLATSAYGKAAYQTYPEMIRNSDIIAVVNVTRLTEGAFKGRSWTYRQKATIGTYEVLKGEMPPGVSLLGLENFICARCSFQIGQQLVFLKYDGEFLAGSNWHLSARPITELGIEWFKNRDTLALETMPAALVLEEVKKEIAAQAAKSRVTKGGS